MRHAAVSPGRNRSTLRFALLVLALLALTAIPASAGSVQVTITSPGDGQTVSGNVSWGVTVTPNNVDHVDFAVDGKVVSSSQHSPYEGTLDTTALSNGSHQLTATAYANGKNGGSTSSSETITVSNGAGPSIQSLPSISGSAVVGQALTASSGTWSGATPMSYAYSWSRCDSSGGSCATIGGAGGAGYTVASADAGATLRVSVTATNSFASVIATSAATPVVTDPTSTSTKTQAPTNTAPPAISGTATVGETLTGSAGTWSGTTPMSYAYSWSRCDASGGGCSPIAGAASATYTLVSADAGATLRLTVTASNSAGAVSATSAATATVTAASGSSTLGTKLPARMPDSSGAKTLIVAAGGSGSSCTLSTPCSLAQAWALAASGTIINLRGGTYAGYQVVQGRRYSASNPVTLQSYPGETATFTGCASSCPQNILYFGNDLGIRIRNITVTGRTNTGSAIKFDDSSYMEIDHVVIHDVYGNGVLVGGGTVSGFAQAFSDHIQIWNSVLYNTALNGGVATNQSHGIYMGAGPAESVKHGVDGFAIANNVFYNQPNGYSIQLGDQASNGVVANNTFDRAYGTASDSGSAIIVWGAGPYASSNDVIVNNLFTTNINHAVQANCAKPLTGISVRGNLGYSNGAPEYAGTYGSVVCFSVGSNLGDADPLYVNRTGGDFHLQSSSPARGKADPAYAPAADASGKSRPATPALGAFN